MALSDYLRQQSVLALVASDFSYQDEGDVLPGVSSLKSFPDSRPDDEQAFSTRLLSNIDVDERNKSFSPYHSIITPSGPGGLDVVEFDNWVVDQTFQTPGNGFGAVLFRSRFADDNGKQDYILAFRGTDGTNTQDWFANLDLAKTVWDAEGNRVTNALLAKTDAKSITFAGQSLGGGLAQYGLYDYVNRFGASANRPQLSLITFNGFGGVRGLKQLFSNFDPNLVKDIPTAHFVTSNDIVHRLGAGSESLADVGGSWHLNGKVGNSSNIYQFSFAKYDQNGFPVPHSNGKDIALPGIVDAHRIESGFYRGIQNTGFLFSRATPLDNVDYLDTSSSQSVGAALTRVFNKGLTNEYSAGARIVAGLIAIGVAGDITEIRRLAGALQANLYRSDNGLAKLAGAVSTWVGAYALKIIATGGVGTGAAQLLIATVIEAAEGLNSSDRSKALAAVNSFLPADKAISGSRLSAATDLTAGDHETIAHAALLNFGRALSDGELQALGLSQSEREIVATLKRVEITDEQFVQSLASGQLWVRNELDYLAHSISSSTSLSAEEEQTAMQQLTLDLASSAKAVASSDQAFLDRVRSDINSFLKSDVAAAISNANPDVVAQKNTPITLPTASTFQQIRDYADSFLAGLKQYGEKALAFLTMSGDAGAADVAQIRDTVQDSSQAVVIASGRPSSNPFDDANFDPDTAPISAGELNEGSVKTFTLFLPYEAATGGQRIKLELAGSSADKLAVLADAGEIDLGEDGTFTLTVAEDQREVSFGLLAQEDVDADATLVLSATLVDGAGEATHLEHEEARILLDAEAEAAPVDGREIRGDWAPKPFVIPNTSLTEYHYDDLGNIERLPGVPNTMNFHEPDDSLEGSTGADHIVTGDSAGFVVAYEGDDTIQGGDLYANTILGGGGNDWIEAGRAELDTYFEVQHLGRTVRAGEDQLYGGSGNDRIWGESEATQSDLYDPNVAATGLPGDWISGGSGDDEVFGGAGDDVLMGGAGEDRLVGGAGMDVLLGDDSFKIAVPGNFWRVMHVNFGDPSFSGFEVGLFPVNNYFPIISSPDAISPLDQDPYVTYYKNGGAADTLIGGTGRDILIGQAGDDTLYGGADDDIEAGWEGNDTIYGGEGDDQIAGDFGRYEQVNQRSVDGVELVRAGVLNTPAAYGSAVDQAGNDFLDGGAGADTIYGEGGDDMVLGGDGNDTLFGDANYLPDWLQGADLLDGGAGDDTLFAGGGDDRLFGGAGNDALHGGPGADILFGGDGVDQLAGDAGADVLHGGAGNDSLLDGGDDDDVIYGDDGADLLQGGAGNDTLYGGNGEDVIFGGGGRDLIDGGAGIDILRGGPGDDTYIVDFGYGADLIEDSEGNNRIRLGAGILPENLSSEMNGSTLAVSYGFGQDVFSVDLAQFKLGGVEFGDGTNWSKKDFVDFAAPVVGQGSVAGNVLNGVPYARNELRGFGGDDTLIGNQYGDFLDGGDGADVLDGKADSDRYLVYASDSGVDSILDSSIEAIAYLDWYYQNRGILDWNERADHADQWRANLPDDARFLGYYNSPEQAIATLNSAGYGSAEVSWLTFIAPLPEAAPVLTRDDPLYSQLTAAGVLSSDLLEFGPGLALADLEITVTVASFSAEDFPDRPWINGGRVSVRWGPEAGVDFDAPRLDSGFDGANLLAGGPIAPSEHSSASADASWRGYRLGEGIEAFRFADGTTLTIDQFLAGATVVKSDNYVFKGNSGDQLIDRRYAVVEFADSIAANQVNVSRDEVDLLLSGAGTQGRIRNWYADPNAIPVTSLVFQSGPPIDASALTERGLEAHGDDGPNTLQGLDGFADRLLGEGGDDTLVGGAGNDVLDGGGGADVVRIAAGDTGTKLVWDSGPASASESDVIELPAAATLGSLTLAWSPLESGTELDGMFASPHYTLDLDWGAGTLVRIVNRTGNDHPGAGIERVVLGGGAELGIDQLIALAPPRPIPGTDGDDILEGTAADEVVIGFGGSDELYGGGGDDTLSGGPGDDYLEGGDGNDTYLFGPGDRLEQIYDNDDTPGNQDTLRFAAGITPGDVGVTQDPSGVHLVLGGGADTVYLVDMLADPRGVIERFEFADGTVWTPADLAARVALLPATAYNDVFWGTEGSDTVEGLAGDDTFYGNGGNDIFRGGEGNDGADGGAGNNLIEGGAGDDYFFHEDGSTLFVPGAGNDNVQITASGSVWSFNAGDGADVISSGANVAITLSIGGATASDLRLSTSGYFDISVEVGTSDSVQFSAFTLPAFRPEVTLQIIGSGRTYDFNAVVEDFLQARALDPGLAHWSAAQSLAAHLVSYSDTHVIGGAIAYRYGTTHSTDSLTAAQIQSVLADPGFGTVAQEFAVAESTNDAPVLVQPIDDQTVSEDAVFSFQAPADTFADPDAGDTLTYSASLSNGDTLPSWLSFNSTTRTFSGTPTNDDVGVLSLKLIATDTGGLSAFDVFGVTVANTNDAPALVNAIAAQNATEDAAFSFTVPANSFADVDVGDSLTYKASLSNGDQLPSWLTFNASIRTFSGTPANGDAGPLGLKVTATDGAGASVSDGFSLTVADTNHAPAMANAIADQHATEDAAFSFQVPANTFADADAGDAPSYAASLSNGGPLPSWLSFNSSTRTFSGTPTNDDVGALSLKLIATDAGGLSAFDVFGVTVANINDAPTFAHPIADQSASANSVFNFVVPVNTFADVDADDHLTYSATRADDRALPSWLEFNARTRTFSGTPAAGDVGTLGVKVTARDSADAVVAESFAITVKAVSGQINSGSPNDEPRTADGRPIGPAGSDSLSAVTDSEPTRVGGSNNLAANAREPDKPLSQDRSAESAKVLDLQAILAASHDFETRAADPLENAQVRSPERPVPAGALDDALRDSPGLTSWAVTNALLQFHLSGAGADDEARGADLGYSYGGNGGLASTGLMAAQELIGSPDFGSDAHGMRSFTGLKDGFSELRMA